MLKLPKNVLFSIFIKKRRGDIKYQKIIYIIQQWSKKKLKKSKIQQQKRNISKIRRNDIINQINKKRNKNQELSKEEDNLRNYNFSRGEKLIKNEFKKKEALKRLLSQNYKDQMEIHELIKKCPNV